MADLAPIPAATVPAAWLDEIESLAQSIKCRSLREDGRCDGHSTADPLEPTSTLYHIGRCEVAWRVTERIRGLRAGTAMSEAIPPSLWLGRVDGQRPIQVFTDETQVMTWLREPSERRRAWRADVTVTHEIEYAQPQSVGVGAGGGADAESGVLQ